MGMEAMTAELSHMNSSMKLWEFRIKTRSKKSYDSFGRQPSQPRGRKEERVDRRDCACHVAGSQVLIMSISATDTSNDSISGDLDALCFAWNVQAQSAFEELKQAMVTTLVLALSNSNTTYTAEANACSTRMGAVLSWEGKPITYFSKASSPKHQALSEGLTQHYGGCVVEGSRYTSAGYFSGDKQPTGKDALKGKVVVTYPITSTAYAAQFS
ncbi:hypothetical protein PVK06_046160 [Gossypium arboreum]|uniref:Reverse transcriptase/retrotransposon-derived protein RNase H-like domain-containing protein n=1 Tax=Gossypium arboreum TaxID=29729 RepID=A0ABR0MW60_GOSAR|nr:hypothetical protein PVK06_046160 [Gossypium arboreum]